MKSIIRIYGGRIIDPASGIDCTGEVLIDGGVIRSVQPGESAGGPGIDARGMVVCPGFVDLHCHLREPGFEHKETIATGSAAAARGGFTTVCCMANTRPVGDSAATIEYILRAAAQAACRVLPIGAVTKGLAGKELAEMGELNGAGVVAFSDDGQPIVNAAIMRHALEYSRLFGRPVVPHCEDPALVAGGVMNEGRVATRLGLKGNPGAAEEAMVARDLSLLEITGGRLHIAHLSVAGSVEMVRRAKARGLPVTAEVTPHHLTLTDEWVAGVGGRSSYDTNTKVAPPIRTQHDCDSLLAGLLDGTIDCIATDHAPHNIVDKACDYGEAASGISGFETALGSLLALVHAGKIGLTALIEKLTSQPARVFGLPYGTLRPGAPADITIFDLNREWVVDPQQFVSLGKNTPLAGEHLRGQVMATIAGSRLAYAAPGFITTNDGGTI
jgi:dihydroorotase